MGLLVPVMGDRSCSWRQKEASRVKPATVATDKGGHFLTVATTPGPVVFN